MSAGVGLVARLKHPATLGVLIVASLAIFGYLLVATADLPILDKRLYYAASDVPVALATMEHEGRDLYLRTAHVDLAFLGVYTLAFVGVLGRLQPPGVRPGPWAVVSVCLPGALDAVETGSIVAMLIRYPDLGMLAELASIATVLKWVSLGGALLCLARAWRARRRR